MSNRLKAALSRVTTVPAARPVPRPPAQQQRKIAILGGAGTIRFAPWHDYSWELWSHASCRDMCKRQPDVLFDLHPPELWRDVVKKRWDPGYYKWLKKNHIPIYMQDRYPDVPASMRYPFETMITEFPRGYMCNQPAYMIALALMQGVTHIAVYGCHYQTDGEYGSQRGSMEYWLGVAEGRGVHVLIPPTCDLLNRPALLYGYESHPNGKRSPLYNVNMKVPPRADGTAEPTKRDKDEPVTLQLVGAPGCPPLMKMPGHEPALERSTGLPASAL